MRFNPPPNWPLQPGDWSPPPDWEPDPSWPEPPSGWQLWIEEPDAFPAGRDPRGSAPRAPWHRRTKVVVLFLIFFFPVGLVLLWRRTDWSPRLRGAVTGVVAVLFVIGLAVPSASSPDTSPQDPVVSMPQSLPSDDSAAPSGTDATASSGYVAPLGPSTCGAPRNPYGYTFCAHGRYITSPARSVCSYFQCISGFRNGRGYMVQCRDGKFGMQGGIRTACSGDGGVRRPVYLS